MKEPIIKSLTAVCAGVATAFLGGWDKALEIMLIVMVIDYITGVSAAFVTKTLKSSKGYEGLLKKGSMFLVVILAAQVDKLAGNTNAIFRTCTACFFIANEALSVIENARRIGIELPTFIEKFMVNFKRIHGNSHLIQDIISETEQACSVDSPADETKPSDR